MSTRVKKTLPFVALGLTLLSALFLQSLLRPDWDGWLMPVMVLAGLLFAGLAWLTWYSYGNSAAAKRIQLRMAEREAQHKGGR